MQQGWQECLLFHALQGLYLHVALIRSLLLPPLIESLFTAAHPRAFLAYPSPTPRPHLIACQCFNPVPPLWL